MKTPVTNTIEQLNQNIVIQVSNLNKSFGNQQVLQNTTLQLFKGENLVVLGKSGSGKSVLIKCLVGLLNCDSGTINILGKNITELNKLELNEIRKKIGFLFQSGALYDSMTVKENIEFPLRRIKKGLSEKEIDAKVKEALVNVDLLNALNKMPAQLSGGMRKRISLARTIVTDPLILLYDEPTTGLDPVTAHEISLLITSIQKKYNTSSIIITHNIACARITANRIIMLKDGAVFKEGTIDAFNQSSDAFIHSFFN